MAKPMRLPNGFGNINKLSGIRRKPFRARVPKGYTDDGKRIWLTLGYYAKYNEALAALVDYNRDPSIVEGDITFAEAYGLWIAEKTKDDISESQIGVYKASLKYCEELHSLKLKDIKLSDMQEIIDKDDISFSYKCKIKTMFSQVFEYAEAHDFIEEHQNKTKHLKAGKSKKSDKHYRFTQDEIDALWTASSDDVVKVILIMIYSGARPGEILNLKKADVNIDEGWFSIVEGKNNNAVRKVPIHQSVLPFYKTLMSKKGSYLVSTKNGSKYGRLSCFTNGLWSSTLEKLGILEYSVDSTKRKHLPHDTRHTFASMWTEKRLNEIYRRKIQGHSGQGIGEQVYTHIDIRELKEEMDKL
jgi:integrase